MNLLYNQVFNQSLDPIFITDLSFKMIDANKAFSQLFKVEKEDFSQFNVVELFKNEVDFHTFSKQLKKKKRIKEGEFSLRTRSKKGLPCLVNAKLLSDETLGQPVFLMVVRDLSKRKKAEKSLVQAEKLLMTGKLARTIAHEVRNPLTNLHLALEQLKDEVPEGVTDAELYFDVIKRNADRIGNLISALLDSSRPKPLQLESVNLHGVIEEAHELVKDRITLKEMRSQLDFDQSLPNFLVDKTQMILALSNVFINAIEAMEAGRGILKIRTKKSKKRAIIEVADNGHGISKKDLENLFEPFFSSKSQGTGLGLTAVQNIIQAHNGTINVKSVPGTSTTFLIALPL